MQNPFEPKVGNNSFVDALIGNAYEVVKYVAYYVKEIRYVAFNMEHVHRVSQSIDDDHLKIRTEVPLTITGNTTAPATWASRDVRATAAAVVKVPVDAPVGFTFNLQRGTEAVVGLELDGADVFQPSFGSGTGVTRVNITNQNGWVSVIKMADGIIAVVGQCEDGTSP